MKLLKRILEQDKWFTAMMVAVLYTATAILILVGISKLYFIFIELRDQLSYSNTINTSLISAHFISIIDLYLLAIVFYIFAIGIYKLFLGNFTSFPWLRIENIDDLKNNIARMTILFLTTLFVQRVTEWTDMYDILFFGIAIAVICAVLILYSNLLRNHHQYDSPAPSPFQEDSDE